ncbi:MAG: taurine dioxygenase [Acidimicrobiia bacterium]|nr:taurine dioxygenase [Acidimicrobiia bacterium]
MTDTLIPTLTALDIRPVAGNIGAIIEGLDLSRDLVPETVLAIRAALTAHRVIFFRNQSLTIEQQVEFAARFGPLTKAHPNVPTREGHDPRVLELESSKANHWHTDVSFVDHPPRASVLAHVRTPEFGADTAWANTVVAYETLPPALQQLADSIDVIHSNDFDYGNLEKTPEERERMAALFASSKFRTAHPAVRIVEETGERSLYLGGFATKIDGFSPVQSRTILDLLQNHIQRIDNTVRWRWQAGDVAFWDNRTTQHTMVDDIDDYTGRHLRRVTIAGDRPIGPDGRTSRNLEGDASFYTPVA